IMSGRTGCARRRLNHVAPVRGVAWSIQLAAPRKFSRMPDVSWAAAQEIGMERKDDVSLGRAVNGVEVPAKGQLRALARAVADGRLPLVPLGLRKKRQERLNLRCNRGRCDNAGQDAETRTFRAFHIRRDGLRAVQE